MIRLKTILSGVITEVGDGGAHEEAKRRGLKYIGFGRYVDPSNPEQIVAKSERGRLVAVAPDQQQEPQQQEPMVPGRQDVRAQVPIPDGPVAKGMAGHLDKVKGQSPADIANAEQEKKFGKGRGNRPIPPAIQQPQQVPSKGEEWPFGRGPDPANDMQLKSQVPRPARPPQDDQPIDVKAAKKKRQDQIARGKSNRDWKNWDRKNKY